VLSTSPVPSAPSFAMGTCVVLEKQCAPLFKLFRFCWQSALLPFRSYRTDCASPLGRFHICISPSASQGLNRCQKIFWKRVSRQFSQKVTGTFPERCLFPFSIPESVPTASSFLLPVYMVAFGAPHGHSNSPAALSPREVATLFPCP